MKIVKRNFFDEEGHLLIKPYRIKDLAEIYDVSTKTMRKWIASKAGVAKKESQYFTVHDVAKIVSVIGLPQKINIKQAA